jgi:hypothetical protein
MRPFLSVHLTLPKKHRIHTKPIYILARISPDRCLVRPCSIPLVSVSVLTRLPPTVPVRRAFYQDSPRAHFCCPKREYASGKTAFDATAFDAVPREHRRHHTPWKQTVIRIRSTQIVCVCHRHHHPHPHHHHHHHHHHNGSPQHMETSAPSYLCTRMYGAIY